MTYDQLVAFFDGPSKAAQALGVDRRLVDCWKKRRIPSLHQLKADRLSDGKLKPDTQAKKDGREWAAAMQPGKDRARATA